MFKGKKLEQMSALFYLPQGGHDMTYSAAKVANALMEKGLENGVQFTPMQLLKLVYICHGWMLGLTGKPLVRAEDQIEAWRYGPVIRNLYNETKKFKNNPVTERVSVPLEEGDLDPTAENLVDQVYNIYGDWDGIELSTLTHKPGTPWHVIWNNQSSEKLIPNNIIQQHYAAKASSAG